MRQRGLASAYGAADNHQSRQRCHVTVIAAAFTPAQAWTGDSMLSLPGLSAIGRPPSCIAASQAAAATSAPSSAWALTYNLPVGGRR
jgi:hypothetical protein